MPNFELHYLESDRPEGLDPIVTAETWDGFTTTDPEQKAAVEKYVAENFFNPDWLASLDMLDEEGVERLKQLKKPEGESRFYPKYDAGKVEWLKNAGVVIPEDWRSADGIRLDKHPHVVTLTILVKWLRAVADYRNKNLVDRMPAVVAAYYGKKITKRLNLEGDRMPHFLGGDDETVNLYGRSMEDFVTSTDGKTNPLGTVSPRELWALRQMLKESFTKPKQGELGI